MIFLNDVSKGKDLLWTRVFWSESYLLLMQYPVNYLFIWLKSITQKALPGPDSRVTPLQLSCLARFLFFGMQKTVPSFKLSGGQLPMSMHGCRSVITLRLLHHHLPSALSSYPISALCLIIFQHLNCIQHFLFFKVIEVDGKDGFWFLWLGTIWMFWLVKYPTEVLCSPH